MGRKTLIEFDYFEDDMTEIEALTVGHSIVNVGGGEGGDRCFLSWTTGWY